MSSYAVRITHPQAVVRHIIASWATQCEKIVAYEHTDAKKIHSHLLIVNTRVEKKQLRNIAGNCGVSVKGNENMSFRSYDGNRRALVYMTKGKFSPYYLQGFTQDECEEARKLWDNTMKKKANTLKEFYESFDASVDLGSDDFKQFKEFVYEQKAERDINVHFEYVRKKAHQMAFSNNDFIANGKFFSDYKMLVYTYCFRHSIPIPRDWKGNQ